MPAARSRSRTATRCGPTMISPAASVENTLRISPAARMSWSSHLTSRCIRRSTGTAEALSRFAGIALRGDERVDELRVLATRTGCNLGTAATWDDIFFQIFLDRVEPHLGRERPTLVFDWPLPLAALARRKPDDPLTVERFELSPAASSSANAFGELCDPVEQRARFVEEAERRRQQGRAVYPMTIAGRLRWKSHLRRGYGLHRLVMLVTGATTSATSWRSRTTSVTASTSKPTLFRGQLCIHITMIVCGVKLVVREYLTAGGVSPYRWRLETSIFRRGGVFRPGSCASRAATWATIRQSALVCGKPDSFSDQGTGSISAGSGRSWSFCSSEATRARKPRTSAPQDNTGPSSWR